MWDFIVQYPFIVGALTGSVAAFLLGLWVDYLRREKKWVGVSINSRKIVERGHPKLHITYEGREIERLHSHTILIRNIGNRALKDLPVWISSVDGSEIVEYETEIPEGSKYNISLEGNTSLKIECDLLNQDEAFSVGFTTLNSKSEAVKVVARGENVICKEISPDAKLPDLIDVLASSSSATKLAVEIARLIFR